MNHRKTLTWTLLVVGALSLRAAEAPEALNLDLQASSLDHVIRCVPQPHVLTGTSGAVEQRERALFKVRLGALQDACPLEGARDVLRTSAMIFLVPFGDGATFDEPIAGRPFAERLSWVRSLAMTQLTSTDLPTDDDCALTFELAPSAVPPGRYLVISTLSGSSIGGGIPAYYQRSGWVVAGPTIAVLSAEDSDSRIYLGYRRARLAVLEGSAEAPERLKDLEVLCPNSALVAELLGEHATFTGNREEARIRYEEAARRLDSDSPPACDAVLVESARSDDSFLQRWRARGAPR